MRVDMRLVYVGGATLWWLADEVTDEWLGSPAHHLPLRGSASLFYLEIVAESFALSARLEVYVPDEDLSPLFAAKRPGI